MVSDLGFDGKECVWFPNSNVLKDPLGHLL